MVAAAAGRCDGDEHGGRGLGSRRRHRCRSGGTIGQGGRSVGEPAACRVSLGALRCDLPRVDAAGSVALVEADGNVSWDLLSAGERGIQLTLTATPRAGVVNYVRTEKIDERRRTACWSGMSTTMDFATPRPGMLTGFTVFRGGPQGRFQDAKVVEGDVPDPSVAAHARTWTAMAIRILWS